MKLIVAVLFFFASFYPSVSFAGRCTGSSYCTACTNCSRCKHCSGGGGSCGVCGGGSNNSYRSSSSSRQKTVDNTSGNDKISSSYDNTSPVNNDPYVSHSNTSTSDEEGSSNFFLWLIIIGLGIALIFKRK